MYFLRPLSRSVLSLHTMPYSLYFQVAMSFVIKGSETRRQAKEPIRKTALRKIPDAATGGGSALRGRERVSSSRWMNA